MNDGYKYDDWFKDFSKYLNLPAAKWYVESKQPEIKTPAIEGPATYSTLDELIGAETY